MLKKVTTFLMAVIICVGFSVTAFAASVTVKSGDGSVTLHEVTAKETTTFRINKRNVTATIYYCPSGSTITIEPDLSDTARFGSWRAYLTGDGEYETMAFTSGTDFTANYSGYALETYFASATGEVVYVDSDAAPSTATPVKSDITISGTVTPKEKPTQDTEKVLLEAEKILLEAEKVLPEAEENLLEEAKAPAETTAPTHDGSDIIHTVKMGDTFSVLALNYFGDTSCWPAIYNYNAKAINATKNKQIFKGMELAIPPAIKHGDKTIAVIAPCVAEADEKLYTVKSGDTLDTIAFAQYKDASKSKAIFERNADRLVVNTLLAGQIIVLPAQ